MYADDPSELADAGSSSDGGDEDSEYENMSAYERSLLDSKKKRERLLERGKKSDKKRIPSKKDKKFQAEEESKLHERLNPKLSVPE